MNQQAKTTLQLTQEAYEAMTQAYAQFNEYRSVAGVTQESSAKETAYRIALGNMRFILGIK